MPQGVPFTPEIKQIFFRVIHFVESEKNGPQIPMNNSTPLSYKESGFLVRRWCLDT